MERFTISNTPEDGSAKKINNKPEISSKGFDGDEGKKNKYEVAPEDDIRKRAGKVLEEYDKDFDRNNRENKYEVVPRDDVRKRAEEILEKYSDGNKGDDAWAMTIKGEKIAIENKNEKKLSSEEVEAVVEKYLSGKERTSVKEIKDFGDFVKEKIDKPITRRNALKLIIGGAAAALFINKDYLLDNINVWWSEFQEQEENGYEIEYSKEMTALYKELEKFPEKEIDYEKVNKNLNGIGIEFKHAKFIKNSEKKEVDKMIDSIIANDNDIILFGEYHGVDSNAINAVKVLEKLKEKSGKKITKIAFEFLDFNDPKSVELIEKFNNKQISAEDFHSKSYFQGNMKPLLEFAQKNNISIEGLEDQKNINSELSLMEKAAQRAVNMSLKSGSLAKEKNNDNILVIFSGVAHSSKSGYGEKKGHEYLSPLQRIEYTTQTTAEQAVEKNLTFKEYLEEFGFKPAVIKLEDINHQAQVNNNLFGYTYNFLKEEDAQKISEQWKKEWQNYKIDRKNPFSINSNDEKNSYLVVNPSEIPNTPPALNAFEEIKKNFYHLHKMIRKVNYVNYIPDKYEMNLLAQTGADISAKLAEIKLESGKIKKLYLPEQLKKIKNIYAKNDNKNK